ncbi:ester cyclase [Sagittula sp. SSi028]|uniref:ester cyclase n=1 Tax=Sagittula sp. SSi028 TaxID=3400636 RepID=UPI003AF65B6D
MPFLPGFDEAWQDAAEFVSTLRQEIWTARRFDRIAQRYAPDARLITPMGISEGPAAIAATAQAELAAMPDVAYLPEDMLWGQSGYTSFAAAERQYVQGHHDGCGLFGAPTGQQIGYRTLSERWCRGNQVVDHWQIADHAAVYRAQGLSPEQAARRGIVAEGGVGHARAPLGVDADISARHGSQGDDSPPASTLREILQGVMAGDLAQIVRHYDRAAELNYPGGETLAGLEQAQAVWAGLRASFPDAVFTLDHVIGMEEPLDSPQASARWSLRGRHDGFGTFGPPSGAEVLVMGMTQVSFGPEGVLRDWTLFDPVAVWRQILLSTGAL